MATNTKLTKRSSHYERSTCKLFHFVGRFEFPKSSMSARKRQKVEPRRPQQKKFMQVGQRGFLVTCNFREKECIRESYNLLNSFHNDPEDGGAQPQEETKSPASDAEEEADISTQLANEIQASKATAKARVFQAVNTETGEFEIDSQKYTKFSRPSNRSSSQLHLHRFKDR